MMDEESQQRPIQRMSQKRDVEARRRFDPRAFVPERTNAQITKRYNIDSREVGAGAFGKVFVAEDNEVPGRRVAIKKFMLTSRDMRRSFEREVSLMKELDHPNICKILETYENGRVVWVVMEYCSGGEVFDRIDKHGPIEEGLAAKITKQVAGALKYAHGRGIAHRDLKPENVCFCSDDRSNDHVKVIDWGVGFHFSALGMCSAVGSETYAAPEVLQASDNNQYSSACDLWSMGVMAYVMLCGKPPFWGSRADQLRRMRAERYPMSDATWQGISEEGRDFIRRSLKVDPALRLSIDAALAHPWLAHADSPTGLATSALTEQVLGNCRQFCKFDHFRTICAASVAKQLDHRSLRDVHKVFVEMDTNGDGVLELREVVAGFEKRFGKGSEQARGVEEMFQRLDLDGSGRIDYTEFCAAGLGVGEGMTGQDARDELALRAAFKAFDVNDDNNRITRDEIQRVLASAVVGVAWPKEVVEEVTEEIFERYDTDKDGSIDFNEFLQLMRDRRYRHSGSGNSMEHPARGGASCDAAKPSSGLGAEGQIRNGQSTGLTLLEKRPIVRKWPSLTKEPARGAGAKEPGRGTALLRKFTSMLSKNRAENRKATAGNEESAG